MWVTMRVWGVGQCGAVRVVVRYNAGMSAKKDRVVTRRVLPNFIAREEGEPLERQFDLHFDLLFPRMC